VLYRCYKQALERLKTQYHNAGLTVVRPAKPKVSRAGLLKKETSSNYIVIVKLFFIKNVFIKNVAKSLETNCLSRLCQENPSLYGIKNASLGNKGYVHDSWKWAVQESAKLYYAQTSKEQSSRREVGTFSQQLKNDEIQSALYRGYKIKLEQLKSKYWNAGLKIKAVQPAKQREKREGYIRGYRLSS